tara:strand:- start:325 stop:432 length:108 start_codon:yes stop_codon:yes gene_type:complete
MLKYTESSKKLPFFGAFYVIFEQKRLKIEEKDAFL